MAPRVARLRAAKFGLAKNEEDQSNVTIVAHNDERVTLEAEGGAEDATQQAAKASMNEFAKKQMWRKLQQKYGMEDGGDGLPPGFDMGARRDEFMARTRAHSSAGVEGRGFSSAAIWSGPVQVPARTAQDALIDDSSAGVGGQPARVGRIATRPRAQHT